MLRRIFTTPPPTDLAWSDVESVLRALHVAVVDREDARIALVKDGEAMIVYRPRPKPLALGATIRDVAAFLRTLGLAP